MTQSSPNSCSLTCVSHRIDSLKIKFSHNLGNSFRGSITKGAGFIRLILVGVSLVLSQSLTLDRFQG